MEKLLSEEEQKELYPHSHTLKQGPSNNEPEWKKTYDHFKKTGGLGKTPHDPIVGSLAIGGRGALKNLPKSLLIRGARGGVGLIQEHPLKVLEVGLTGLGAGEYIDNPQDVALETVGMRTDSTRVFNPAARLGIKKLASIIEDAFSNFNSPFNRKLAVAGEGVGGAQPLQSTSNTPLGGGGGGTPAKGSTQLTLEGIDFAYNYPIRNKFPWESNARKAVPPKIGGQVEYVKDPFLGHNARRTGQKLDINLADFNWSDPNSYRQFELVLQDIIQADDILANQITRLRFKGSQQVTKITKQKGVSQIYYDYLNAYFNRWIATGIETDFSKAAKLIMPNGKTIQGSQPLARDLRRFYMNPKVFGSKAFVPGSKEYKQGIAKVLNSWQLDNKRIPTKWEAHHLNVIDESWPLFIGLKPDEVAKLRKRLEQAGVFSGDDPKNLQYLPKEIHEKVHGIFWKTYRPPWAGKGGSGHSSRQLMTKEPGFNTAAAREERIKEYISAYKKVDQELNFYIHQFLLNNKGVDMNNPDAIVDFLDNIDPPPGF